MSSKKEKKIAVCDCETDPFAPDRKPMPFVWGFEAEDIKYTHFWSDVKHGRKVRTREEIAKDCTDAFVEYLYGLDEPYLIYAHNGGKFDYMFLLEHFTGKLRIVNGRILEAHLGPHTFRDSYAIMPYSLATYKKDDCNYDHFELDVRQAHKTYILKYLAGDCRYLLEMVTRFWEEFGDNLTVGGTAMRALKKFHTFDEFTPELDAEFREFYYGGRNQAFEIGEVKGQFITVDENSAYPAAMRNMLHPVSSVPIVSRELTNDTDFLIVEGENYGGLPMRLKTSLSFVEPRGTFKVTGHELRAALDTGTFRLDRVVASYEFSRRTTFAEFVDEYYRLRNVAGASGDDLLKLFYKYILNSGYGKFALNSDNFKDWYITDNDLLAMDPDQWNPDIMAGDFILWSKPSPQKKFYNVATGASITGAARSMLLRGLAASVRPIYCDTDSIICEKFTGHMDSSLLGAWKLESECDTVYIAGKKMYAQYVNGAPYVDSKGNFKKASKGARLTPDQIKAAALGEIIDFRNPVPAFKLDGSAQFVHRKIRKTGTDVFPFGETRPTIL